MSPKIPQAAAVVLVKGSKTYISKRINSSTYQNYWQNPGGKLEAGETPLQAIVRETKEETGLNLAAKRFLSLAYQIITGEAGKKYGVTTFIVKLESRERPKRTEKKHSSWKAVNLADIMKMGPLVPALESQIPKINELVEQLA